MVEKSRGTAASFADLSNKLSNPPSKKSLFERQKAEAEAKRIREEKETAAVYEDFVKSFDQDDENEELLTAVGHGTSGRGAFGGGRGGTFSGGGGPGKRHFTARGGKNSGPGSLGPGPGSKSSGPGSLGPVPPAGGGYRGQKRPFNEYGRDRDRDHERDGGNGMFSYEDHDRSSSGAVSSLDAATAFRIDENEDQKALVEKAAPKPTLHLSSLPPGSSPAFIKSIISNSSIPVENVRILPNNHSNHSSADRKSTSAIVTLPTDTPAADIDTLVSQLQNKYLGFGFYLSLSRHLSSTTLSTGGVTAPSTSLNNLPFGARSVPQHTNLSRGAPPPGLGGHRGGFAPPASYTSSSPYSQRGRDQPTQVIVNPPSDLKQLKLIHLTLEALLTHGPEFEALLMSRREVQRDEKWAWLWDARSRGGVYYRWRLWAISTDADLRGRRGASNGAQFVFEHSSPWIPPDTGLKFEYTTRMEDFIEDEAYDSSDEEDYDDDARMQRRRRADQLAEGMGGGGGGGVDATAADSDGTGYLNPLAKAKLVHLLARLPDSNTKLRRGDVARVTAFAIEHAGEGADEVASIITANVRRPLSFTSANPERQQDQHQQQTQTAAAAAAEAEQETEENAKSSAPLEKKDTTAASLVALYIISDILMSSTTSGVRHAWRYRALFENSLKLQETFQYLGGVDRELGWGRLKAEKWKRSVQGLLSMWEGWCVFPQASQEGFVEGFVNPPGLRQMKGEAEMEEERKKKNVGGVGKWKSVEDGGGVAKDENGDAEMQDVDGAPMVDEDEDAELDGVPMEDDDMLMGTDEDLDGEPLIDSSDEETQTAKQPSAEVQGGEKGLKEMVEGRPSENRSPTGSKQNRVKRQRPKAVDMFADESDEE